MSWNETNISIVRSSVANNLLRLEIVTTSEAQYKYKINGKLGANAYASVADAKNAVLNDVKTILENAIVEVNSLLNV